MGIIIRQSIKHSISNYIGALLGIFSTLFIYPLDKTAYGLTLFIVSSSELLLHFGSLGINASIIRFFPQLENKTNGHNGILGFAILFCLIGYALFCGLTIIFEDSFFKLLEQLNMNSNNFEIYQTKIILLGGVSILNICLTAYTSNFHRIVVPNMLFNLVQKISLPILIYLSFAGHLSNETLGFGIIGYYAISTIGLSIYLVNLGQFHLKINFKKFTGKLRKDFFSYSLYSLFNGLGSTLSVKMDHIMIASYLNLELTGIYGIAQFIGNSIAIPSQSILGISNPIVSKCMNQKDYKQVQEIYSKSSTNLLIIGGFLAIIIILYQETIFSLTQNLQSMYPLIYLVIPVVILGKLIDMITSINSLIITHSQFYRINFWFLSFTAILNIVLNIVLIEKIGLMGAAIATTTSFGILNILRLIFVYRKFKMHPFTTGQVKIMATLLLVYLSSLILPHTGNSILNMAMYIPLQTLMYLIPILLLKISPEGNNLVILTLQKIGLGKLKIIDWIR